MSKFYAVAQKPLSTVGGPMHLFLIGSDAVDMNAAILDIENRYPDQVVLAVTPDPDRGERLGTAHCLYQVKEVPVKVERQAIIGRYVMGLGRNDEPSARSSK